MYTLYTAHALTRRDEEVFDSIALDDVVCIVNYDESPIKSLHLIHCTNCQSVNCITPDIVHCTREGSAKGLTSLWRPKMYAVWVRQNITVSRDEGELV